MVDLNQFKLPLSIQQVNSKPVSKLWNDQLSNAGKSVVVIQGRVEYFVNLGKKIFLLCCSFAFCHISKHAQSPDDCPLLVPYWARAGECMQRTTIFTTKTEIKLLIIAEQVASDA